MDGLESFRDGILSYLLAERDFSRAEIESHSRLSREEKVGLGLLLPLARVVGPVDGGIEVLTPENNSKLRVGDKVSLEDPAGKKKRRKATVVENRIDSLVLAVSRPPEAGDVLDVVVEETVCLDPFINQISGIAPGLPGAAFLSILAGVRTPERQGRGALNRVAATRFVPTVFDIGQADACKLAFGQPAVACIQGCPGCGKTRVLSAIADAFATSGKEVLVTALTHQAVNNALNAISKRNPRIRVAKIGDEYRTEGLAPGVSAFPSFREYRSSRTLQSKNMPSDIVGMTLLSSMVNVGAMKSGFLPTIALVDEAGQIPLAHAAAIGTFGCGSIVFFGDAAQMPPIYRPELVSSPLSVGIMERIAGLAPALCPALSVTYRMNDEITKLVGRVFYEPRGIRLSSAPSAAPRRLRKKGIAMLSSEESVVFADCPETPDSRDADEREAEAVAEFVQCALGSGLSVGDMAVITPYRRQVKAIRDCLLNRIPRNQMPLVDTVERLQGQDVELIVLSFASSDPAWIAAQRDFLFDPHRLNVMISRAKTKVVVFAGESVRNELRRRLGIDGMENNHG